jgi:amidase
VPTAIKDLNLTAGTRTTLGSTLFRDFVPPVDDNVVTLLRRAGTISLGKTNTPEFGLPCYTENAIAPPARTPWDPTRSAGGSSGGAAAAVAAGLVPFAQGSDGGGSVRIPSSVCGLFGIKVSRGRISNGPIGGDVTGLAWNGPLARSVRDAAALLDAMAVPMPGDPHWAPPLEHGATFLSYAGRDPGKLRIGRYATPVLDGTGVHPDCLAAYEAATAALTGLGHEVEDVEVPFPPEAMVAFATVWGVSAASAPVDPAREGDLLPLTRWLRGLGAGTTGAQFVGAMSQLQMLTRQWVQRTAQYDAILSPTLASPPVPVGWFTETGDPAEDFARQTRFTPFTATYNVTGQPAVNVPLHWTEGERTLPIGIMLAGRPADEATLVSLSAQLEDAVPWVDRHPPGW